VSPISSEAITQSLRQPRPNTADLVQAPPRPAFLRPRTAIIPSSPPHSRPGTCPRIVKSIGHAKLEVPRRVGKGTPPGFILIPRIPPTIWFAGTGTNRAEWSALPGISATILSELQGLDEEGEFSKYLAIVEALISACIRADRGGKVSRFCQALWKQLVVTTNNFAVRSIELKR